MRASGDLEERPDSGFSRSGGSVASLVVPSASGVASSIFCEAFRWDQRVWITVVRLSLCPSPPPLICLSNGASVALRPLCLVQSSPGHAAPSMIQGVARTIRTVSPLRLEQQDMQAGAATVLGDASC
jgi:hypothetical protein